MTQTGLLKMLPLKFKLSGRKLLPTATTEKVYTECKQGDIGVSVTALLIMSKGLDINPKNVWAQNIAVNSKNVSVFNKAESYLEPMCLYL